MRILHTENSCGWGGQEIRILSEATGMMARGHLVHHTGAEKELVAGDLGLRRGRSQAAEEEG